VRWRPPRLSLVARFGILSLLPILLLGAVLGQHLRSRIRNEALDDARLVAVLSARMAIQPRLSPADLADGLTPPRAASLESALRAPEVRSRIARVKVWNDRGRVVYSDDPALIGRTFPISEELGSALDGDVSSEVSDLRQAENVADRRYGRLLEVYVPMRFGHDRRPAGAFELYLPYAPVAARITRETTRIYLLLAAGLALLWATLSRIVVGASKRLRDQAIHDALTGLPNRTLFHDRVEQALCSARREERRAAVLLMDLDRFKEINDTLGHHIGDRLLRQIGPRVRACLRQSDTVARLGGDEFAVLLPDVAGATAAQDVAAKVRRCLEEPFVVDDLALHAEASIGIALVPEHGHDAESLVQRADVAMYQAKEAHSGHALYDAARDEYDPARLGLVGELRRAIGGDELVLHYQPKLDLASGGIEGVEALVRWQHPRHGRIPPGEFIPLAERTGLMKPLTLWVLETAIGQCATWQRDGLDLSVAVNLSAANLVDMDLPDDVARLLERSGLAADRLTLEITESTVMADPPRARAILERLAALDVRLAIDDFGTGHASLAYLKRLPVHELKIDRSFVVNVADDMDDAVIVHSTIDLGHNLGLRVVAEGVETGEALRRLVADRCDLAQGFLLSRPLPAAELIAWLASDPAAEPARAAAAAATN
jgi:diguanylate cyclase (GGDEF)-like protein